MVGEQVRTADAHDAGRFAGLGNKCGQLMLMMLVVWRGWGKARAADGHDAGRLVGCGKNKGK